MDYKKSALKVLEVVGGSGNIISATHCATRLRLIIANSEKCDKDALEIIDGVKGVFESGGQLQIIFGIGEVNRIYDAFITAAGITAKEEKQTASSEHNRFIRVIKNLFTKTS